MTIQDLQKNNWKVKLVGKNLQAPCYLVPHWSRVQPTFLVDQYEVQKGAIKLNIYVKSKNKTQIVYRYEHIDSNNIIIPIFQVGLSGKFKYLDFKNDILKTLKYQIGTNSESIQFAKEKVKRDIANARMSTRRCNKMINSI